MALIIKTPGAEDMIPREDKQYYDRQADHIVQQFNELKKIISGMHKRISKLEARVRDLEGNPLSDYNTDPDGDPIKEFYGGY